MSKGSKKKVAKKDSDARGQCKSGRPWKTPKQKFASVKKSIYRRPLDKKVELRNDLKHIKEVSKEIKEKRKEENEFKKKRRMENAEKRKQNELKSEVVQVIKNPAKLKRLRKKQLRNVEKRDFDQVKTA
ncbi:CCDC86 family protein [Megaselia abdita]